MALQALRPEQAKQGRDDLQGDNLQLESLLIPIEL